MTIEAAAAQLVPPLSDVPRPFRRLKRRRGQGDYAGSENQNHPEDIAADLPAAEASVKSRGVVCGGCRVIRWVRR